MASDTKRRPRHTFGARPAPDAVDARCGPLPEFWRDMYFVRKFGRVW